MILLVCLIDDEITSGLDGDAAKLVCVWKREDDVTCLLIPRSATDVLLCEVLLFLFFSVRFQHLWQCLVVGVLAFE